MDLTAVPKEPLTLLLQITFPRRDARGTRPQPGSL